LRGEGQPEQVDDVEGDQQHQHSGHSAPDATFAAAEGGPAQHHGGEHIELIAAAGIGAGDPRARKERDAAFAKFDTDNNGSISKAEFDAHAKLPTIREPEAKPFLDKFDANKDGAISKDEFRAPTIANFENLDKNKDGTLSVAEQRANVTAPVAPAKKTTVKETPPIGR